MKLGLNGRKTQGFWRAGEGREFRGDQLSRTSCLPPPALCCHPLPAPYRHNRCLRCSRPDCHSGQTPEKQQTPRGPREVVGKSLPITQNISFLTQQPQVSLLNQNSLPSLTSSQLWTSATLPALGTTSIWMQQSSFSLLTAASRSTASLSTASLWQPISSVSACCLTTFSRSASSLQSSSGLSAFCRLLTSFLQPVASRWYQTRPPIWPQLVPTCRWPAFCRRQPTDSAPESLRRRHTAHQWISEICSSERPPFFDQRSGNRSSCLSR